MSAKGHIQIQKLNSNRSWFKAIPLTARQGQRFELRFKPFKTLSQPQWQNIDADSANRNFGQVTSNARPISSGRWGRQR
jgi:hypothetical protein